MPRHPAVPNKYSGVIPGFSQYGGNVERCVLVARDGKPAALGRGTKLFRIELFNPAKATKFALDAILVAVVISLSRDEPVATDCVISYNSLHNVDRKREAGNPRVTSGFVCQIELGRGHVLNRDLSAQIVANAVQQMRLLAVH
jgi:hypothetical protein